MTITSSPNPSDPPELYRLNEYEFQDLTCALLAAEPHIVTADLFGERGQKQYGIDVIGHRKDGGIDVASCKRYENVRPGHIVEWSSEFLDQWEAYWKPRGVKRFVLALTAPIHTTQVAAKILAEGGRFHALGIEYEVWGPRQFQEKLRPNHGIALQFLAPEHANRICGMSADNIVSPAVSSNAISQLVVSQLALLQAELSTEVEGRLDIAMEGIRRGDLQRVAEQLAARRNGAHWNQIRPATQARVVRLQGSLRLQHGDIVGAERFADEADAIALPDEPRLRVVLAARKSGAEAGLRVLGEPSSRDGVQLKLALLLESGRRDEAISLLETHPTLRDLNAETQRLRAFAELLRGRRTEALQAAQRAESQEPQWPAIRRSGAIIRYALALSPIVPAEWCLTLNPIDLDLVREDDEAQANLADALSRFEALASKDVDPEMRDSDQIWALACISNMRHRLQEAETRCQAILATVPTHALAILWALARGFEFNRALCIRALGSIVADRQANGEQVLALAWLLDEEGRTNEAVRVMLGAADAFDHPRHRAVRDRWLADHAVHVTEQDAAHESGWSTVQRLATLVERANTGGDWSPVEVFFHDLTTGVDGSPLVLAAARALAAADRWSVVAAHAEPLLRFNTAAALRLVAHAFARTEQHDRTLALLKQAPAAFPKGVLPHDLRVLEVEALTTTDPAASLRAAATLAADSTSIADRLLKANVHLKIGDIRTSLPTIREAVSSGAISVEAAIGLIPVVSAEDPEVARDLWRHAARTGIPRDLAADAFIHALGLGIQNEAHSVFQDMHRAAQEGRGSIRVVLLEEMVEILRRAQEEKVEQQQRYLDGRAPVHAFAAVAGFNIPKIYHLPASGKLDAVSPPFMIRHGARPTDLQGIAPINNWALHVDITALLLAFQLGLLDALERLPQPLAISPTVPVLLVELEHRTRPHQPNEIANCRAILEAVAEGTIASVALPEALDSDTNEVEQANNALRVADSLPDDTVVVGFRRPTVSHAMSERVATLRSVVDALHRVGALDAHAHATALGQLGTYADEIVEPPPAAGTRLLFLANTVSVLAEAGLLDPVARKFRMQVDATYLQQARAEVEQAEHDSGIADALGNLRRRVAAGIENRRYRYITAPDSSAVQVSDKAEDPAEGSDLMQSRMMRCLFDMLHVPQSPGAVLWVDDRYISGYPEHQGNAFLGVTDVLRALRKAGSLGEHAYFEALLRLRAGGAMFIPVEYQEVLYHLRAAPVINGTVQETPALATLRRYGARALLCDRHLNVLGVPAGLEGRPDEMEFLMGLLRLAENCIIRVWNDRGVADKVCHAWASWIWGALRVEWMLLDRENLTGDRTERAVLIPAFQFTRLLVGGLEINVDNGTAEVRRRQAFFRWMQQGDIGARLAADSALADKVIELVRSLLLQLLHLKELERQQHRGLVQRIIRGLVAQFPKVVRQRLLADDDFSRRLQIRRVSTVHTLGMAFEAHQFWKAIAKARRYGRSHVRALRKRGRMILRIAPKRPDAVRLSGGRRGAIVEDPTFGLLDRSVQARAALLHAHLDWFDLPARQCAEAIQRISVIADPVERIEHLNAARGRSAVLHYSKLLKRLDQGHNLKMSGFRPPAAAALLDHLRLPIADNQPFADRFEAGARELLAEVGPVAAFRRMAGLPVPIPQVIMRAMNGMSEPEQAVAVKSLFTEAHTPLQLLHALHLCRALVNRTRYSDQFQQTFDRLLESWPRVAPLFLAILKWSEIAFEHDSSWSSLPATDRLAVVWLHADRISDLILTAGLDPYEVVRNFAANQYPRRLREVLRLARSYHCAAAAPDSVASESLLFHGIGYVLNNSRATEVIAADKIDKLCALLSINIGETRVPSVWLFANRQSADNALGSFLTMRPSSLGQFDASSAAVMATMDQLLIDLEANPLDHDVWVSVWGLTRPALDAAASARLAAVLESIDLVQLVGANRDDVLIARVVMYCWVRYGRDELRARMLEQIGRLSAALAPASAEGIPSEPQLRPGMAIDGALEQLVETGIVWAQSDDIGLAFSRIGEVLIEIARTWPGSQRILRMMLDSVLMRESAQDTVHLWRAWNTMRIY